MKAGDRKEKIDRLKVLEGYDRGALVLFLIRLSYRAGQRPCYDVKSALVRALEAIQEFVPVSQNFCSSV